MTLIASINTNTNPILIGDIALSSTTDTSSIKWPTIGNIKEVFGEGGGYIISGYTQKLHVVGDNLVIAFSGTEIAARTIAKELTELSHETQLSYDLINQTLENNSTDISKHLSIIGCFIENTNEHRCYFRPFAINSELSISSIFGDCIYAGSGSEIFNAAIDHYQNIEPNNYETGNYRSTSINKAFAITSLLHYQEHTSYTPLLHYFGGSYEICYMDGGKFKKLDKNLSVYWSVKITVENEIVGFIVHNIYYTYYSDDIYVISCPKNIIKEDSKYFIGNIEHFLVNPITRQITENDIKSFNPSKIDPEFTSHFVEIHFNNNTIKLLRIFEHNQQSIIKIHKHIDRYTMNVDFDYLRDRVKLYIDNEFHITN